MQHFRPYPNSRARLHGRRRGFTLVEIMMVLVLLGTLIAVGTFSVAALMKTESLEKGLQMVKEDMLYLRSRAISVLKTHRFLVLSESTYVLQEWDSSSSTWVNFTGVRTLPSNVAFRAADVSASADKLEFGTNGLPDFNGADNSPFITVTNEFVSKRKGVYVEAGGAIYEGVGLEDPS